MEIQILKGILLIFGEKLDVSDSSEMLLLKTLVKLKLSTISQHGTHHKGIPHWKRDSNTFKEVTFDDNELVKLVEVSNTMLKKAFL